MVGYVRGNKVTYPFAYPIGMWPRKLAQKYPNKLAIVDLDRSKECTYKDLHIRSNILANSLLDKGLKKGDRVAVLLANCVEFMEVYLACSKLGITFLPLNWRLSPLEWKYQTDLTEPSLLVVEEEFVDNVMSLIELGVNFTEDDIYCLRLPGSATSLPFKDYELLFADACSEDRSEQDVDMEDIQVIMFTSGTTGLPKGAMLSYRKNLYCTISDVMELELTHEDRSLLSLPLFHSGGLNITMVPALYAGGTVFMKKGTPEELLQVIEEYGITKWLSITYHARAIVAIPNVQKKYKLKSLKAYSFGGEIVPAHIVRKVHEYWPHITIIVSYGATEASYTILSHGDEAIRHPGVCGKPVFYADIRIVDDNDNDVRQGQIGELLVTGPIMCSGYWKNPEVTQQIMKDNWFHSGDLVRMDDEGFIYIVDRKKDMIICGGENIHCSEIETIISEHPKVSDVAVIGVPDEKWGERPIAIIVPKGGQTVSIEEVRELCRGKLAKFKIPDRIELTDQLPYTGSGKIAKWQLREKYRGGLAK